MAGPAPRCTCVKPARIAARTGKAMRMPPTRGPRAPAARVNVTTMITVTGGRGGREGPSAERADSRPPARPSGEGEPREHEGHYRQREPGDRADTTPPRANPVRASASHPVRTPPCQPRRGAARP